MSFNALWVPNILMNLPKAQEPSASCRQQLLVQDRWPEGWSSGSEQEATASGLATSGSHTIRSVYSWRSQPPRAPEIHTGIQKSTAGSRNPPWTRIDWAPISEPGSRSQRPSSDHILSQLYLLFALRLPEGLEESIKNHCYSHTEFVLPGPWVWWSLGWWDQESGALTLVSLWLWTCHEEIGGSFQQ